MKHFHANNTEKFSYSLLNLDITLLSNSDGSIGELIELLDPSYSILETLYCCRIDGRIVN